MTPRNYRPLVVLAALALSACPFNFKYNVENGSGKAVALRPEVRHVAVASAADGSAVGAASPQDDRSPSRLPGG